MSENFQKAGGGLYWAVTEKLAQFVLRFIITTLIAREIGPIAFGVVALVIIFEYFFLYLMDMGLNQVVIQRKGLSDADINTAFTFNIILGAIFTFVFFNSAGIIANFLEEDILKEVIQILSFKIVIISFGRVHIALLERNFEFKKYALISVPVRVASGALAIICIFQGLGIWSYIYYLVSQSLFLSLSMLIFSGFKPRIGVSFSSLNSMLNFGVPLSFTRIVNALSEKFYYIVIGKYYDASTLGLFQKADSIRRASSEEFATLFNKVLFPLYSKAKNFSNSLLDYHNNIFPYYVLFFALMSSLIIGFSDELIFLLLGQEWADSADYLKYLSVLGLFSCLNLYCVMIRKATAAGKVLLYEAIFERGIRLAVLFASLPFGVVGVLVGQIFSTLIAFIVRSYTLKLFFSVKFLSFIGSLFIPLGITVLGCFAFYYFTASNYIIYQIVLIKLLIALCIVSTAIFGYRIFYLREFNSLVSNIRNKGR